MLADFETVESGQIIQPGTLSGLMDIYEQNFIRLRKIAPDLDIADSMISISPGHMDLYLSVTERCKFTTMLRLTYCFKRQGKVTHQPDMQLKIYHDAKIVEVLDHLDQKQQRIFSTDSISRKWNMNRFLFKWLLFCTSQKHYFHPVSNMKKRVKAV